MRNQKSYNTKTTRSSFFYIFCSVVLFVGVGACVSPNQLQGGKDQSSIDIKTEIRRIAKPYAIQLIGWEMENLFKPVGDNIGGIGKLPGQIDMALKEEGILVVPSVKMRFVKPPSLLVISPRDRIQYFDRLLLLPDLNDDQKESLESQLAGLNLSSLVIEIGGFGAAYPAIVSPTMTTKAIINASVEEWAHQYLALRPLGFLYLLDSLGIMQDTNIIDMNETLAGIIADEIGDQLYKDYYEDTDVNKTNKIVGNFDVDNELHLTRITVDSLLVQGNVVEAEQYMEQRRRYINSHGYNIRKINQAYFAYYGIYGQSFSAVSSVYEEMMRLRNNSSSLSDFINKVASMTNYSELQSAASNLPH